LLKLIKILDNVEVMLDNKTTRETASEPRGIQYETESFNLSVDLNLLECSSYYLYVF